MFASLRRHDNLPGVMLVRRAKDYRLDIRSLDGVLEPFGSGEAQSTGCGPARFLRIDAEHRADDLVRGQGAGERLSPPTQPDDGGANHECSVRDASDGSGPAPAGVARLVQLVYRKMGPVEETRFCLTGITTRADTLPAGPTGEAPPGRARPR